MNILDLFIKSDLIVKFIILILITFSIVSWSIIIQNTQIINAAIEEALIFKNTFLSGIELSKLYKIIQSNCNNIAGFEYIFYSGFKEFSRLRYVNNYSFREMIEDSTRTMRISINYELERLETNVFFLGIIGSISPYIGLFGTVWGIMHAFIGLGIVQQTTLQIVAPGIAEALISTVISLFTAIPAVIAFNRLNQKINKLENNYDNFIEEFISIMKYQIIFNDISQ